MSHHLAFVPGPQLTRQIMEASEEMEVNPATVIEACIRVALPRLMKVYTMPQIQIEATARRLASQDATRRRLEDAQ